MRFFLPRREQRQLEVGRRVLLALARAEEGPDARPGRGPERLGAVLAEGGEGPRRPVERLRRQSELQRHDGVVVEILAHATTAQDRREQKARRVQRTGGERDAAPRPHDDRVVVVF